MDRRNLRSFRFLFADRKDIYFSRYLVKMDFQQYCFLKLREEGYQSVIFIDYLTADTSALYCVTEQTADEFKKNAVVKGGGGWFSKSSTPIPKEEINDGKSYTWMMQNDFIRTVFFNLLDGDTKSSKRFAFVIDIDTFNAIFPGKATVIFENFLRRFNLTDGSIFVITAPDDYSGSLPGIIRYMFEQCRIEPPVLDNKTGAEICNLITVAGIKSDYWEVFYEEQIERMAKRIRLDNLLYFDENGLSRLVEGAKKKIDAYGTNSDYNRRKLYGQLVRDVNNSKFSNYSL